MKYVILGLGVYGSSLTQELTKLGHEVIAIDNDERRVEQVNDYATSTMIADVTDPIVLESLPLNQADAVIVAIGENFAASIKTVAFLKKMKIKHILARAIDDIHARVLESMHVSKILYPEKASARHLARSLEISHLISSYPIDGNYYIIQFSAPNSLIGLLATELDLKTRFGITIISIRRANTTTNFLGTEVKEHLVQNTITDENLEIKEGDIIVGYGLYNSFQRMFNKID